MNYLRIVTIYIIFLFPQSIILGQQDQNAQKAIISTTRIAEGQTKMMVKQFNIDMRHFLEIYNINLKYQLRADSVRMTIVDASDRRRANAELSWDRDNELKKILTEEQYNNYQKKREEQRMKAIEVRKNN